jgi:hypothetical protein
MRDMMNLCRSIGSVVEGVGGSWSGRYWYVARDDDQGILQRECGRYIDPVYSFLLVVQRLSDMRSADGVLSKAT